MDDNEVATKNLTEVASSMALEGRIIFSKRVFPNEYLARLGIVDLFLDCFPYNAGSTARDALFMGAPILTLSGRTLVSRMAGSILNEAGLNELITHSTQEYVSKAISIGNSPFELLEIKRKVEKYTVNSKVGKKMAGEYEEALFKAYRAKLFEP